jgi:hypothetical protein
VEQIHGRYVYRLVRTYRAEVGGGKDVLGEVSTVGALEELLRARTPLTLADLREVP